MKRYGPMVFISLGLVVLDLCAWCVLLGGFSVIQHRASTISKLFNANSATATYLDIAPQNSPGRVISFEWFKAVFQVVALLCILAILVMGQVHRFRLAMIGILTALAVLWCDACQTFYYLHLVLDSVKDTLGIPEQILRAVRCYFSGCIMSATFNFLLIITLGTGLGQAVPVDTYSYPKDAAAATTTTTTTAPPASTAV